MSHTLGISVYPDLRPLDEIKEYIKLASKYGFKRIFSSMFSVEGSKEEVLDYFRELIEYAHEYNMEVDLDVNPGLFKRLGASEDDLSVFADIKVDVLRMDLSYGGEKDYQLVKNPHGIKIEFNSSPKIVKGLVDAGAKGDEFMVCHNFYPQRYTGLSWNSFLEKNKEMKELTNVNIGAFVSSNNTETHGVWDSKDGLPTVERLRGLPIDLQARVLLATGMVNDILIGNAYATEEELKALSEVVKDDNINTERPILKILVETGTINLDQLKVIRLKPEICPDISETEKSVIFDFEPHMSLGDNSEWMWRSRMSRLDPDLVIEPRKYNKEYFEVGSIVMVNDNYKHYSGEVQIVKEPMENDGERNYIGKISEEEKIMLELLDDISIVKFLK